MSHWQSEILRWRYQFGNWYLYCPNNFDTVKASNFGPHGNLGPFLANSVASLGEFCAKNEENRLCKSKVCLQLLFHSFLCRTRFDNSKSSRKNGPKFPWGPKLEALTVHIDCCIFDWIFLIPISQKRHNIRYNILQTCSLARFDRACVWSIDLGKNGVFFPENSPRLQGVSADTSPASNFILSQEAAIAGLGADALQPGTQPVFNWITFIQTEAGRLDYIRAFLPISIS